MNTFVKISETLNATTLIELMSLTPDERARLFDFSEFIAGVNARLDAPAEVLEKGTPFDEALPPVATQSTPAVASTPTPTPTKRAYKRKAAPAPKAPAKPVLAPPVKCPHCEKECSGNAGLSAHIRFVHKDVEDRPGNVRMMSQDAPKNPAWSKDF